MHGSTPVQTQWLVSHYYEPSFALIWQLCVLLTLLSFWLSFALLLQPYLLLTLYIPSWLYLAFLLASLFFLCSLTCSSSSSVSFISFMKSHSSLLASFKRCFGALRFFSGSLGSIILATIVFQVQRIKVIRPTLLSSYFMRMCKCMRILIDVCVHT